MPVSAQDSAEFEKTLRENAENIVKEFINNKYGSKLELYYYDSDSSDDSSLALRYDYDSTKDWTDDAGESGTDFSGKQSRFFAKGNFVFDEEVRNPTDMSEIGGSWAKRWFKINVANPLTQDEGKFVQKCMLDNPDFEVEECREKLGHERTELTYWYIDLDGHIKIEGDQNFDQRHYVFGFETNLSRPLGQQSYIINPIVTMGLESVDPKDDEARSAVLDDDDTYSRYYIELGFTGVLAKIKSHGLKHSFKLRRFEEIDAPNEIKDADLDSFNYWTYAIQVPAPLLGLNNDKNSFVVSYSEGELPFGNESDEVFEIGFRHNIDFEQLLFGTEQ
jgi:hypothetical protein